MGSPAAVGSTSASRSATMPGSLSTTFLRPPPGRRERAGGPTGTSSSSRSPSSTVGREIPAALHTAATPPLPSSRASAATTSLRWRSFRCGQSESNLRARVSSGGTPGSYEQNPELQGYFVLSPKKRMLVKGNKCAHMDGRQNFLLVVCPTVPIGL